MSVLIGITTRNRKQILPKAIDSALSQRHPSKRVYVFDDNSSDGTFALQLQYPTVQWEKSNSTRGLVFARNKMMREANEEFFCSLDDDAWFMAGDELEVAVDYFRENPNAAAIAFDILSPDRTGIVNRTTPFETANFIGCGHLLRLSAVKEAGYYEPYPFFYGAEEKDLCLKLIESGYKTVYMPGVHVWHDKENFEADEPEKHESGVANDLVFMYRRSPSYLSIFLLFIKILKHFRFALTYKRGKLLRYWFNGILRFISAIPSVKRSPVKNRTLRKFNSLNRKRISQNATI